MATRVNWGRDELRASVQAYLEMLRKYRNKERVIKSHCYRDLAKRFGRTEKAYEMRIQNISYVLGKMGREWLPGVPPLRNVGARVGGEIEALIAEVEGRAITAYVADAIEAVKLRGKLKTKPRGTRTPVATTTQKTTFSRDGTVRAWVMQRSAGACECCKNPAPFFDLDGIPFLEIHHLRHLADNGSDTPENAVALCPNCHREIHLGLRAADLKTKIYRTVKGVVAE